MDTSVFYIPLMFIAPGISTIIRLEKFQENSNCFVSIAYQSHLHFIDLFASGGSYC